jgi:hypothetical protein
MAVCSSDGVGPTGEAAEKLCNAGRMRFRMNDDESVELLRAAGREVRAARGPCPRATELAAYLDGRLSGDAATTIQVHVAACGFCDLALSRAEHANKIPMERGLQGMWRSILTSHFAPTHLSKIRRLAWVAVVFTLMFASMVLYRVGLRREHSVARGSVPRTVPTSRQDGQPGSVSPAEPPGLKPEPPRQVESRPIVATLMLTSGERGTGTGNTLIRHPTVKTFRLVIGLEEDPYATYRVLVASADLRFKREFDGLRSRRAPTGGKQLVLELPATMLGEGDYTITIFALKPPSTPQPIGGYSFSVVQPKN